MSLRKTCKAGMTSLSTKPGYKIEIPVIAHAAGSHSPQCELTQRNSKANTAEIHHYRRSCRNGIEYIVRPPMRLQLRLFEKSFASPRMIGVQV